MPYNLLISRSAFESEASKYFELVDYHSLGLYLFMSRVVQPLFRLPDPPDHLHDLNRIGLELQQALRISSLFEDCDYAGVYVFRRKG